MTEYGPIDDFAVFERYPDIQLTHDNIEHYRALMDRKLVINRCRSCRTWIYPHRPVCPACLSWDVWPEEVSGLGRIHMYTRIMQLRDPQATIADPVVTAAVELVEQDGLRYLSRVVNCDANAIVHDMPVRLIWMEVDGRSWPAFEPFAGRAA